MPPPRELVVTGHAETRELLGDARLFVPEPASSGRVGTVGWLRASVSRFANGAAHDQRLGRILAELGQLEPVQMRRTAFTRSQSALRSAGRPGDRVDAMSLLARRCPVETLATALGLDEVGCVAEAVVATSAGYFTGPADDARQAADDGVATLVRLCGVDDLDRTVARITLMVQASEATAGLIGAALHVLQEGGDLAAGWPTDDLLAEVARHRPPLRFARRVADRTVDTPEIEAGDMPGIRAGDTPGIQPGDVVIFDIEAANRDPAVFGRPDDFDPQRPHGPDLTFGHGLRPCPARQQAMALAAGVVDAVRMDCIFVPGQTVDYGPPTGLQAPRRLDVILNT